MESTKEIGQRDVKGSNKGCFIFDSWFSSSKLEEAVMVVGLEIIGMAKTRTKLLFRDTIENHINNWPGGSYLLLRIKPMVPGYRLLISISCKYNVQKILSFIVIDHAGGTNSCIPYLYKYTESFSNVCICPVDRLLAVSKFFASVNEVDSHNK